MAAYSKPRNLHFPSRYINSMLRNSNSAASPSNPVSLAPRRQSIGHAQCSLRSKPQTAAAVLHLEVIRRRIGRWFVRVRIEHCWCWQSALRCIRRRRQLMPAARLAGRRSTPSWPRGPVPRWVCAWRHCGRSNASRTPLCCQPLQTAHSSTSDDKRRRTV